MRGNGVILSKEARETRTNLTRAKAAAEVTEAMAGHRKVRASTPWAAAWSDGANMQERKINIVEEAAATSVCSTAVGGNFESERNDCRVVLRGWRSWSPIADYCILALQQCGNNVLNSKSADGGSVVW